MPGVFADILQSLQDTGSTNSPVDRLDRAGAQAIAGARSGANDLDLMLRKFLAEQFGGQMGFPPTSPGNFVGPMQPPIQPPQAQENSILQRLFGGQ